MPDLQPAILCGRETFADIYRAQAAAMAERMGKLREKEVGKREAFIRYVQSTLTPSLTITSSSLPLIKSLSSVVDVVTILIQPCIQRSMQ